MPRHRHAVRALTGALTTVVLALAAVVGPAAGSASAAVDSWRVPTRATVTVPGHGYGHGHGLSQYGAQRAARQGLGYRRIVEFYYPGTRWGRAGGKVSVLISADTSEDVVVDARSRLTLRGRGSGRLEARPAEREAVADRARLPRPQRGVLQDPPLAPLARGPRRRRVLGGRAADPLRTPAGAVRYRGVLRSASPAGSRTTRDTVNVLPLDSYLRGVLPREVPALWHPHAVRAQAVAARTYAAYERAHPIARHYQICDTAHCQVYGGASAEHPAADDAVRTHRTPDPDQAGRPRVRAVLGQQRRVDVGGRLLLPAGSARSVRRVVGQPVPLLADLARRPGDRAAVAAARQPDPDPDHPARRQRRLGRPGGETRAHRRRGLGHDRPDERRHVPAASRPAVHMVHVPGRAMKRPPAPRAGGGLPPRRVPHGPGRGRARPRRRAVVPGRDRRDRRARQDRSDRVRPDERGPAARPAVHGRDPGRLGRPGHPQPDRPLPRRQRDAHGPQPWRHPTPGQGGGGAAGARHRGRDARRAAPGRHRPGGRRRAGAARSRHLRAAERPAAGDAPAGAAAKRRRDVGAPAAAGRREHEPGAGARHRAEPGRGRGQPADRPVRPAVRLRPHRGGPPRDRVRPRHGGPRRGRRGQALPRSRPGPREPGRVQRRGRPGDRPPTTPI